MTATGKVYAWGVSFVGQVGDGTALTALTPVRVASGATMISSTANNVAIVFPGKPDPGGSPPPGHAAKSNTRTAGRRAFSLSFSITQRDATLDVATAVRPAPNELVVVINLGGKRPGWRALARERP
jgi:hypothetical protein